MVDEDLITKYQTLRPFFKEFQQESDRATTILAGVLLDDLLKKLLKKSFVKDADAKSIFDPDRPLGSFSAKINAAYYLGLISQFTMRELDLIRCIRNSFAHGLTTGLRLDSSPNKERINELQIPQFILDNAHLAKKRFPDGELERIRSQPRRRFEIAVGALAAKLQELELKLSHRASPKSMLENWSEGA